MRIRRLVPIALLCALALVSASCSGDDGDGSGGASSGGGAKAAVPLEGTSWVLSDQTSLGVPLGDVAVTAHFTTDTMSGSSGCNGYQVPIARDGKKLTVTGPSASTQISCGDPTDRVERAYLAKLPDVRTYAISGEQLTLLDRGGKALLVYRAGGVNDIVGKWNVTSLYTGNAISSTALGTTITAEFTKDSISGSGGCNQYNGPATIGRTAIRLGPFATTLKACPDPAGTQEQQYLHALDLARTWEVQGDRLTLFRPGGTIAVTLERA